MGLQSIRTPISVARTVMERCVHNVLCGPGALEWALDNGFERDETVLTDDSRRQWLEWKSGQPISHPPSSSNSSSAVKDPESHDTVGVICLDGNGRLCVGTSTSGWKFKHAGRVGDSPIIGSGLYCNGRYGAAVCTGDGEEIMRTCLSYLVVESMRQGHSPQEACRLGIERLYELSPKFNPDSTTAPRTGETSMHTKLTVGVIAMSPLGEIGAAGTLSLTNPHRGRPGFPVACWRRDSADSVSSGSKVKIEASLEGATY